MPTVNIIATFFEQSGGHQSLGVTPPPGTPHQEQLRLVSKAREHHQPNTD